MVLSPKRWKSRSSPGIAAGVREVRVLSEPIHNSSSRVELVSAGRHWLGAGWSSPVARQAHNLKVVGSNPTPATKPNSPNELTGAPLARSPKIIETIAGSLRCTILRNHRRAAMKTAIIATSVALICALPAAASAADLYDYEVGGVVVDGDDDAPVVV